MRRFLWALAASAAMHGVLLSWLWAEHPLRPPQAGVIYAHAMRLAAPAPPLTARPAEQRVDAQVAPAATPQTSSAQKPPPLAPGPQTHTAQPVPAPAAQPQTPTAADFAPSEAKAETVTPSIGYLGPDEVDRPAEPVGDWVIDARAMAPGQPVQWHIRIWISANGNVDGWELIGDSAHDPVAQQALRELNLTVLNPARLDGVAVPSYRNLELSLGAR